MVFLQRQFYTQWWGSPQRRVKSAVFCGTLLSFSGTNDPRMPLRPETAHPRPDGHYLLGDSQPRAPIFDVGFNASTRSLAQWYQGSRAVPQTYVSNIFNDLGLVVRGIEPAIKWLEWRLLPKAPRENPRFSSWMFSFTLLWRIPIHHFQLHITNIP